MDTGSLGRLYVLFFIHHQSRRVGLAGVTANPTTDWVTQRAGNISFALRAAEVAVRVVVRDNDAEFGPTLDELWRAEAANVVRPAYRTPVANSIAERGVGSLRAEVTDYLLLVGRRHLDASWPTTWPTTTGIVPIAVFRFDRRSVAPHRPRPDHRRSPPSDTASSSAVSSTSTPAA